VARFRVRVRVRVRVEVGFRIRVRGFATHTTWVFNLSSVSFRLSRSMDNVFFNSFLWCKIGNTTQRQFSGG
jgi:hypothetical protein